MSRGDESQLQTNEQYSNKNDKKAKGRILLSRNSDGGVTVSEPICTMTLVNNLATFTKEDSIACENMRKLEAAVSSVVDLNPVLGGQAIRVVERKGKDLKTARVSANAHAMHGTRILIELGVNEREARRVRKIRLHETVKFNDEDIIAMNKSQRIDFLHKHVEPRLPELGFGYTQISKGSVLFKVSVVEVTPNIAAYAVSISHLLVDGSNYYTIIEQIGALMEGKSIPKHMKYETPVDETFTLYSDTMSKKDIYRVANVATYGFILRLIFGIDTWAKRFPVETRIHIIDKEKVDKLKKEMHDPKNSKSSYLSSNDIMMAAFARHVQNRADTLHYVMDCRGKLDGVEEDFAGNFEKMMYISAKAAGDPNSVRKCTDELGYYSRGGIPFLPLFRGRYSLISNWTSLTKFLPLDILCHAPPLSFVNMCPIPMWVVFKVDTETTAILRNHCEPSKNWKKKSDYQKGDDSLLNEIILNR